MLRLGFYEKSLRYLPFSSDESDRQDKKLNFGVRNPGFMVRQTDCLNADDCTDPLSQYIANIQPIVPVIGELGEAIAVTGIRPAR